MAGSRISDKRIAELKHDEAVMNSISNREKKPKKLTISRCSCGSSGCGGFIWNQTKDRKTNGSLPIR